VGRSGVRMSRTERELFDVPWWAGGRWSGGADPAVGVGDLEGAVGVQAGVPSGSVDDVMAAGAQQHEVARFGRAALLPRDRMVCLAPGGGAVAAAEAA